jgi:hypothetical protein
MTFIIYIVVLIKFTLTILLPLVLLSSTILKLLLLIGLSIILYILFTYPRTRFYKLSQVRDYKVNKLMKYALRTYKARIYNILVLLIYSSIFITGLLYLRFSNQEKQLNLITFATKLKDLCYNLNMFDLILNGVLFILLFIVYLWLFIRAGKYFKFHIIKLHLFLSEPRQEHYAYYYDFDKLYRHSLDWFYARIFLKLALKYDAYYKIRNKTSPIYNTLSLEEQKAFDLKRPTHPKYFWDKYKKDLILYHTIANWHYLVILLVVFYDIKYNDYILTKIFYILPWTFIYDSYVRASKFIYNLWAPFDEVLHRVLYYTYMEIWDKNTIMIDGELYDYNYQKMVYHTYFCRGFVRDPQYI